MLLTELILKTIEENGDYTASGDIYEVKIINAQPRNYIALVFKNGIRLSSSPIMTTERNAMNAGACIIAGNCLP